MRCRDCLCHYCTKILCPRDREYCFPCYNIGFTLECPYFQHRVIQRVYHFKKGGESRAVVFTGSLRSQIEAENSRHRRALKEILRRYNLSGNATK